MNAPAEDPSIYTATRCPVCASTRIEDYLATDLTTFFFPVPREMISKVRREPFRLAICNACSHIFQSAIRPRLLALIYDELYAHYNLDTSQQFQDVYRERTLRFLDAAVAAGGGRRALDIGCGEGTYFPFFAGRGYTCHGIEPSRKGILAKEKNPAATVAVESFEAWAASGPRPPFQVILMNWVLEHMTDPAAFFETLRPYLQRGTRIVIQVPDICYYMDHNLALFYLHEHINYFTPETLEVLLKRKGFAIVSRKHGDCASILMCGEYGGVAKQEAFDATPLLERKKAFVRQGDALRASVRRAFAQYERVVLYGVGLLAFWIGEFCLADAERGNIELIDDNAYYRGKMVPSFNKELATLPEGSVLDGTLIFISTSPSYHDAIRARIRQRFRGRYAVAVIRNNEVVTDPAA